MPPSEPPVEEKRDSERFDVAWTVDCETEDTFLFAAITNISAMGIFVRTDEPLPVGTIMYLRFAPSRGPGPFILKGRVQWVNRFSLFGENLNPGMGIMFVDLAPDDRERLVQAVRSIAYLRGDPTKLGSN
ncbi:MAG: PilZ domain-containing protein [Myxococcales bacterium]|nr:PilZ domain-containing protein [Myxococcales bacterium]